MLTQEDSLEKMVRVILQKKDTKFVLCGHSLGAWVAQAAAIQAPDRVEKLILMGAWSGEVSSELINLFNSILARLEKGEQNNLLEELIPSIIHSSRLQDQGLLQIIRTMHHQFPKSGLINQVKAEIQGGDLLTFLDQIKCPTLLIHGREDAFFSIEHQMSMVNRIPHAKFTIIENCGHMIPIEHPEATTALIRLWLTL